MYNTQFHIKHMYKYRIYTHTMNNSVHTYVHMQLTHQYVLNYGINFFIEILHPVKNETSDYTRLTHSL